MAASAMIFANVYQINDNALLKTPDYQGFSLTNVKFRSVPLNSDGSSTVKTSAGTSLYGIIQELPRGLQTNSTNFYVVETVTLLKGNAS